MADTLIVYLHGIGDNIMLSGVLKEYCRQQGGKKVDFIVLNVGCAAIWKNNPLVESVQVYPGTQPHFWNPALFYPFHQFTVRRYIRELNADGRWKKVFFPTIQTIPELIYHVTGTYGRHKMDRICAEFGLPPVLHPYDLPTTPAETAEAETVLQKFPGARLAVMHPFSGHVLKRLSPGGVGEIIKTLRARGYTPLVVGSPGEARQLDPAWEVDSVFGLSLGVLIEILKRTEIFAGTDSAVAHLAAYANTSRLLIFSPKLEPRRYLPITERSRLVLIRYQQKAEARALAEFQAALEAP